MSPHKQRLKQCSTFGIQPTMPASTSLKRTTRAWLNGSLSATNCDHPVVLINLHAQLQEILRNGVALDLDGLHNYTDIMYASAAADPYPTRHFHMVYVEDA